MTDLALSMFPHSNSQEAGVWAAFYSSTAVLSFHLQLLSILSALGAVSVSEVGGGLAGRFLVGVGVGIADILCLSGVGRAEGRRAFICRDLLPPAQGVRGPAVGFWGRLQERKTISDGNSQKLNSRLNKIPINTTPIDCLGNSLHGVWSESLKG